MPKGKNTSNTDEKELSEDFRTRNWAFIQYDDSSPQNWRDILDEMHVEWIESPLHDKDFNPDGTPKKPHRHILLLFSGNKTYKQVKEITDLLNCPRPKNVLSARATVRYMSHLDNPEKAQYPISQIISHGGADLENLLKLSSSQRYDQIKEMLFFVRENNISEFQDLMDYAMEQRYEDWFPLLCDSSAYIVQTYIKSVRHRPKNVNLATGEIMY